MNIELDRKIVYLAGFLFSIPLALTSYINSSALEAFMPPGKVGILYAVSALITIVTLLEVEKPLKRFGNRVFTFYSSLAFFVSLLVLAFSKNALLSSLAFILYFLSSNTIVATLDIFVEYFSKNKSVGKFRGAYIAILSLAWVLSQTISGSIIAKSSYSGIYIFSSVFMLLFAFLFHFYLRDFKDPKYKEVDAWGTLVLYTKTAKLRNVYLANLILKFFFSWMIIYTPIYLHEVIGLGWDKIGLIFSVMLTPFAILPYPLGRLSDKIGEKKMLALGFLVSATATALIPLIKGETIWLWALILFATRVGAATIETMSESYFFKVVDEENADAISFFRNTTAVSFLIGPMAATTAFLFIPSFSYLFFILSAVLLCGISITMRLKEVY